MLGRLLNPFSDEAKSLLDKSPAPHELSGDIFKLAEKKVTWKKKSKRPPDDLVKNYDEEKDILSFFVLFQAVASSFSLFSGEVRLVKEVTEEIIRERLKHFYRQYGGDYVISLIEDLIPLEEIKITGDGSGQLGSITLSKRELYGLGKPRYGVKSWRSLEPLLRAKEARLTDWYIVEGMVPVNLQDLFKFYSKIISVKAFDYMTRIHEKLLEEELEFPERYKDIAQILVGIASEQYKANILSGVSRKLDPDKFPPCINNIISGVSTGSRNYAISVLLTSFLSYARIAPKKTMNPRIVDFVSDQKILTDEILPLIYAAAERCAPPLFEDQPLEKLNVSYHLGLGLTQVPRLEDSGNSHWYFPPNCEKIRREAPNLCNPDKTCKKIRNPITYYFSLQKKIRGKIVRVSRGSGLIQRCPECNRYVLDNQCKDHGKVEGRNDLWVKAKLNDGKVTHNLLLNCKITEDLMEFTLDEAVKLGEEAVLEKINEALEGKSFEVKGDRLETNFLVKGIRRLEDD
ncbi:MAG: hypothetical protein V3R82_06640 [Candidatus Hydrothermarchaeales archaeon]